MENGSNENRQIKIPKRIAASVINSLKGGVVPRVGLPYIAVGRRREIEALLHDVSIVADGGASFRFIAGRYGSGKSFRCRRSAATPWTVASSCWTRTSLRSGGCKARAGRGSPPTAS